MSDLSITIGGDDRDLRKTLDRAESHVQTKARGMARSFEQSTEGARKFSGAIGSIPGVVSGIVAGLGFAAGAGFAVAKVFNEIFYHAERVDEKVASTQSRLIDQAVQYRQIADLMREQSGLLGPDVGGTRGLRRSFDSPSGQLARELAEIKKEMREIQDLRAQGIATDDPLKNLFNLINPEALRAEFGIHDSGESFLRQFSRMGPDPEGPETVKVREYNALQDAAIEKRKQIADLAKIEAEAIERSEAVARQKVLLTVQEIESQARYADLVREGRSFAQSVFEINRDRLRLEERLVEVAAVDARLADRARQAFEADASLRKQAAVDAYTNQIKMEEQSRVLVDLEVRRSLAAADGNADLVKKIDLERQLLDIAHRQELTGLQRIKLRDAAIRGQQREIEQAERLQDLQRRDARESLRVDLLDALGRGSEADALRHRIRIRSLRQRATGVGPGGERNQLLAMIQRLEDAGPGGSGLGPGTTTLAGGGAIGGSGDLLARVFGTGGQANPVVNATNKVNDTAQRIREGVERLISIMTSGGRARMLYGSSGGGG